MVCALADAGWGGREWCALLKNASGCVWWSLADVVPAVGFTHAGSFGKFRSLLGWSPLTRCVKSARQLAYGLIRWAGPMRLVQFKL